MPKVPKSRSETGTMSSNKNGIPRRPMSNLWRNASTYENRNWEGLKQNSPQRSRLLAFQMKNSSWRPYCPLKLGRSWQPRPRILMSVKRIWRPDRRIGKRAWLRKWPARSPTSRWKSSSPNSKSKRRPWKSYGTSLPVSSTSWVKMRPLKSG